MKQNQSGSVLAIGLALLTVITLIAMMSLQRSGLQTKIVANILHKEKIFNTSMNEQEHWNSQYTNNPNRYILKIINNIGIDGAPIPLDLGAETMPANSTPKSQSGKLEVQSLATYILPTETDITLAVGEEAGTRRVYKFKLDSDSSFKDRPNINSKQRSGFSFPGLNISQNSF